MSIQVTTPQETPPQIPGTSKNVSTFEEKPVARRTINKLNWRLMTVCSVILVLSYMDRGNIGYAASDMCRSLRLSHAEYGFGTSVFFIGFVTSQLGSNVMLKRFGAPVWLSFILFAWGCTAALMSLMQSSVHFFVLRFFLGIAEGGAFPGVWYYLTLFYPDRYLGEPYAATIAAAAFAIPISAPLAAGLLSLDGLFGVAGWRILFLVEGLIPIVYSVLTFCYLPASINNATFLTDEERRWIRLEHEKRGPESPSPRSLKTEIMTTLRDKRFWLLVFGFGVFAGCIMTLMYWLALIIQDMLNGSDDSDKDTCSSSGDSVVAVILTAIPDGVAGVLCLLAGRFQSKIRNRTLTAGIVYLLSASSLLSWVVTRKISFIFEFLSLTGGIMLMKAPLSFILNIAITLFPQSMRSTVIALFNSISNLGSFIIPFAMGLIVDASGYPVAICFAGVTMILSTCFLFAVKDPQLTGKDEETGEEVPETERALL